MRLVILITLLTIQQSFGQTTDFDITEANMIIQMPNTEWELVNKGEGELTSYVFKRSPIADSEGRQIIPAIMVFIEDASSFEQDVTAYSINKRLQFRGKGVNVDKVLIHEKKDYPLSYKNAYVLLCSYTDNGLDHIFYMVHLINKDNKGIQIYMDMTKDLADQYAKEFWTTMKSIKEKQ